MPLANQPSNRRSWVTDVIWLGALVTVFYFLWLGSYPLFTPDEGRYSEAAREMLVSGDYITPRVNGVAFLDKPALYYWLQAAAMACFGVNEWAVRFFPACYGIVGCLMVYLAARRLFNRRTGILSAVMLATTPLYYSISHYANLDLEVAVLITAALLSFLVAAQAQGNTRTGFFLLAYICASLGFLTKGMIAFAFPVMIAGLWILLLSRWALLRSMHIMPGIIIAAVITLPWFMLVQRANPAFLHYFFITQQVTRFLSGAEFNNPTPVWFYLPVILLGFLPWSIFLIQATWQQLRCCWQAPQQHAPELFLLLWAAVILVFFSIPHSKTISYILPVFPPLAILCGKYLADVWQQPSTTRGIRLATMAFIAVYVLLAGLLFALPYHWLEFPVALTPTLYLAGTIAASAAIVTLLMHNRLSTERFFYLCAITGTAMLLTFASGAKFASSNSAKPLAMQLLARLQPGDTVVNYFKFYQDIPMYLGRTLVLVADWQSPDIAHRDNWVRELWVSMPFQNTDQILLNEDRFWQRWHSQERIFVFLNENYLAQFQLHTRHYRFIGQYHDIILLENQP